MTLRVSPPTAPPRLVALVLVIGVASRATSIVRIDGSSPEAFQRTNGGILRSLTPTDQTKLVGAELYICAAAAQRSSSGAKPKNIEGRVGVSARSPSSQQ